MLKLKYVGAVDEMRFALQYDFGTKETLIGGAQKYLDQFIAFYETYFEIVIDGLEPVKCGTGKIRISTDVVTLPGFMNAIKAMQKQGFIVSKVNNFGRILW